MTKGTLATLLLCILLSINSIYGKSAFGAVHFQLQGDVDGVCRVENVNVASTSVLDLDNTSSQLIGTLRYRCTWPSGFVREIRSFNNGKLVSGPQSIPYQISHTGNYGLSFDATQLTSPIITNHSSFWFLFGPTAQISVTVPSVPNDLFAGTYTDTITVIVTAN